MKKKSLVFTLLLLFICVLSLSACEFGENNTGIIKKCEIVKEQDRFSDGSYYYTDYLAILFDDDTVLQNKYYYIEVTDYLLEKFECDTHESLLTNIEYINSIKRKSSPSDYSYYTLQSVDVTNRQIAFRVWSTTVGYALFYNYHIPENSTDLMHYFAYIDVKALLS